MPGQQLTSLSLPARARGRLSPSGTCPGPAAPAPAAAAGRRGTRPTLPPRPRPGAHLLGSGFRRSSSLAAECGAAAAAAAAFAAAAATEALPGAPPGLEAGGPRDPRRRGLGARRGRTAGSWCEARSERGASHPRPSSHNFAARVGARSGAEGGEDGARALGREGPRSRQDGNLNGPREKGGDSAGGRYLHGPRGERPVSVGERGRLLYFAFCSSCIFMGIADVSASN